MAPTQIPAQTRAETLAQMPEPGKARVAHIDMMRAIAILSVILGHGFVVFLGRGLPFSLAANRAVALIYAVHMPLFFFLSGLVYRRRPWREVLSRALSYVVVAEVAIVLFLILKALFLHVPTPLFNVLREMLLLDYIGPAPVWFLVAFAAVSIVVKLWLDGGKWGKGIAVALFILSFADSSFLHGKIRVFQLQAWWPGVLALLLGLWIAPFVRARLDPAFLRGWKIWAGVGVGAVAAGGITAFAALGNHGCTFNPGLHCGGAVFHVRQVVGSYGFLPYFLLGMLAGFAVVVLASVILAKFIPGKAYGWIGRNTLALYLLNAFVIEFANMPLRDALRIFYPAARPVALLIGLPVALVALHLLVVPAVIPAVKALEHGGRRLSEAIVGVFPAKRLRAS